MVGRDPLGGFDVKPRRWGVSEPCIISPASQDQYIRKAQTLGDDMPVQDEGPSNALPLELGLTDSGARASTVVLPTWALVNKIWPTISP